MMVVEQAQDPVMQELVEGLNQLTTSRYLCSKQNDLWFFIVLADKRFYNTGTALVLSIYDWLLLAGDGSFDPAESASWSKPIDLENM
jgi:hypothetical protein